MTDHVPFAARVVGRVCTGDPDALLPEYTFTVTVERSPLSVPPVPRKVGVESLVAAPAAGLVSVTTGGVASTAKELAVL